MKENNDDDKRNQPSKNRGTMIVDTTCAPSQIKYPRDAELLNEAREKLDISVVDGMIRLEKQSFDAYNESEPLVMEIENYQWRYGYYPERES